MIEIDNLKWYPNSEKNKTIQFSNCSLPGTIQCGKCERKLTSIGFSQQYSVLGDKLTICITTVEMWR